MQSSDNASDDINAALDTVYALSGPEAEVVTALKIKEQLKDILEKTSTLDRDIHNLGYRRDLDEAARQKAEKDLIDGIEIMKLNTPINVKVTNSKSFIKYAKDPDLKSILSEYQALKSLNVNKDLFLEATKKIQSKAVISTKVKNVELYYADGRVNEITLVTKDITFTKPEDEKSVATSSTASYLESIPKSIIPSAKELNMLNTDYKILKDDPLMEFPATTLSIEYYMNKSVNPEDLQQIDTILIDKNVNIVETTTGLAILGDVNASSISTIFSDGKTVMISIVILLIIVYLVISFGLIDKIRSLGLGTKKKVKYLILLINDAQDHISIGDYDKASLIYREIKLNYEASSEIVQKQVFEDAYLLCNKIDIFYFNELYLETDEMMKGNSYLRALENYERLEKTFNKIDEKYKKDLLPKLEQIYRSLEQLKRK